MGDEENDKEKEEPADEDYKRLARSVKNSLWVDIVMGGFLAGELAMCVYDMLKAYTAWEIEAISLCIISLGILVSKHSLRVVYLNLIRHNARLWRVNQATWKANEELWSVNRMLMSRLKDKRLI